MYQRRILVIFWNLDKTSHSTNKFYIFWYSQYLSIFFWDVMVIFEKQGILLNLNK